MNRNFLEHGVFGFNRGKYDTVKEIKDKKVTIFYIIKYIYYVATFI